MECEEGRALGRVSDKEHIEMVTSFYHKGAEHSIQ